MRTGAAHDVQCAISKSLQYSSWFLTLIHWYIVCADDTVNQLVREVLLPTFKEIQGNIYTVKNDLSSFNVIVNNLTEKVSNLEEHQNHISSKMDQLESKLDSNFKAVENQLMEHKTLPTLELSEMINECLQPNVTQPPNNDSLHTCGVTGGWRRVVYLDMTDPNTTCPSGWQLTSYSNTTCGRVNTGYLTCDSVIFPVSGGDYTRVCGRIKGYQYRDTDAFEAYDDGLVTTIDGAYVGGISLTHGSPGKRKHIWTFAGGHSEVHTTLNDACPCDATINITIPPFVGGDYFCESGYNSHHLMKHSLQMILSGMAMTVLVPTVHVATILRISLNNSPALPLMI